MPWLFGAIEELLPVVAFFGVQQAFGFEAGLVAMMAVMGALFAASFWLGRRVPRFAVASTIAVVLFAIPSVVTGNSLYFQVSDTILNGFFALLLLASWKLRYPILKVLFDRIFAITDEAWHILSLRWGLLFLALTAGNEIVRLGFSLEIWSAYKLISTIGVMLFGCYQFTLSARRRIPEESNWLGLRV